MTFNTGDERRSKAIKYIVCSKKIVLLDNTFHRQYHDSTQEMENSAMVFKINCRSFMCDHPSKATHKPRLIYTYRNFEIAHKNFFFQKHHL